MIVAQLNTVNDHCLGMRLYDAFRVASVLVGRAADHLLSCLLVCAMSCLIAGRRPATLSTLILIFVVPVREAQDMHTLISFLCSVAEYPVRCNARAMPQYLRHMNFSSSTSSRSVIVRVH